MIVKFYVNTAFGNAIECYRMDTKTIPAGVSFLISVYHADFEAIFANPFCCGHFSCIFAYVRQVIFEYGKVKVVTFCP